MSGNLCSAYVDLTTSLCVTHCVTNHHVAYHANWRGGKEKEKVEEEIGDIKSNENKWSQSNPQDGEENSPV